MRYVRTFVLCVATTAACDRPKDADPAMQAEGPAVGSPDTVTAPRPLATAEADTVAERATPTREATPAQPTPAPPPSPAPPTGDPAGPTAATAPPAAPGTLTVPSNVLVLSGYGVGPRPTELSHPEDSAPAGEPRADLNARVVLDAGQVRYELYATAPKPWVVKSETPFKLTLRPSNGVRLRKEIYDRRDFADPRADVKQINAELEAGPGEHTIEANVELYVCSADLCKRTNEKVRTAFTIPKS